MYVNWRAVIVLGILIVGGYFAYQKLWVGTKQMEKSTTAGLLDRYDSSADAPIDRQMIYRELVSRAEKPGRLDAAQLRARMKKRDPVETYQLVCELLGRIQDRPSIDVLLKEFQENDARVRIGPAKAFQHMPSQRAIPPLIQALGHPSEELRKASITALENAAAQTTVGVRYKAEAAHWREWWQVLPKEEKQKIPP